MIKKIIFLSLICGYGTQLFGLPSNAKQRTFSISKNLTIFNSVLRDLDMNYVDTLNYDKMMKSTIDDMLQKLDPYTVYLPEEETDDLKFMTTGEYAGIGAMIMKRDADIYISELYEGKPAQKAGVKAGDMVVEIDGKKVSGMSVSSVSALLKGATNTPIKLSLKRNGEKQPIIKQFLREKIQVNPIGYAGLVADKVGYILLNDFTDKASASVKTELNEMVAKHQIESLVLDLRNNGGGLIDEAINLLGFFLPKGTEVVVTKGKLEESRRSYKTPLSPIFPTMKLVILTNSSTASASEITAGAIQDLDRGLIVGERTYGKGLVQSIRSIDFGGHIKLTTAKYYIPSGRCIQAIDYSHRKEDGSVGQIPDSLMHEFKTRNGRVVRDGGGIIPDTVTKNERKLNIAYYIYVQNLFFDFATEYVQKHPTIASPTEFKINDEDFKAFADYLVEKKFVYTSQTEKYYNELYDISKLEGMDSIAATEFAALKAKLVPHVAKSIYENRADISEVLSVEIIKRYYYQKGVIQYSLLNDKDLKIALEYLKPNGKYDSLLTKKK